VISRDAPVGALDTDPSYRHRRRGVALIYTQNQLLIRWLRVVHNHPSGDPTASTADIEMTRQIVEIAAPLGIAVHDHVIVGKDGHASLRGLKLM
jgi:DNA repair protein RadC